MLTYVTVPASHCWSCVHQCFRRQLYWHRPNPQEPRCSGRARNGAAIELFRVVWCWRIVEGASTVDNQHLLGCWSSAFSSWMMKDPLILKLFIFSVQKHFHASFCVGVRLGHHGWKCGCDNLQNNEKGIAIAFITGWDFSRRIARWVRFFLLLERICKGSSNSAL